MTFILPGNELNRKESQLIARATSRSFDFVIALQ